MSTPSPEELLASVGRWQSRMGAFFPGSHVIFRGQELHGELKAMSWFELYVFGVTGRRFTHGQLALLEAIWHHTSYPDVRLWNNRVAGLAGTARSTGSLAVGAAIAVSEAGIYGNGIVARAMEFLLLTRARLEAGASLATCLQEELAAHRSIAGFGRPIVNGDERIPHLLALAREHGLDQGPHLRLAFAIEAALLADGRERMRMNYAAVVCALGADLGLSKQEFYLFMVPVFMAGMLPCYIEAAERPEGILFATPCSNIEYAGPAPRPWRSQPR